MSVTITDCTIRDGGYLFNKNSDPEFVKGIMKGLAGAWKNLGLSMKENSRWITSSTSLVRLTFMNRYGVVSLLSIRIIKRQRQRYWS